MLDQLKKMLGKTDHSFERQEKDPCDSEYFTLSSHPLDPETIKHYYPQISVIVPIYNGEQDIPDLISCLQNQTYPAHLVEYILVDNGSQDHTAEIIFEAIESFSTREFTLRYRSETQIQGPGAARNRGIKCSSGEILVFTDVDCRPDPKWVEQMVRPFVLDQVGIVAGNIKALPGNTIWENYAEHKGFLSPIKLLNHPFGPSAATANLAIRRQVLESIGLFRPYLISGEDTDLCWRMLKSTAWKIYFVENAIISHRHRNQLQDLRKQHLKNGHSQRFLHELHGIALKPDMLPYQTVYIGLRWLLKELPISLFRAWTGKSKLDHAFYRLIDLISWHAWQQGQKEARLPLEAHKIDWLDSEHSKETLRWKTLHR